MNNIMWYLFRRIVKVALDYLEYSLGATGGRTPEQMLDDIRYIRKDFSL